MIMSCTMPGIKKLIGIVNISLKCTSSECLCRSKLEVTRANLGELQSCLNQDRKDCATDGSDECMVFEIFAGEMLYLSGLLRICDGTKDFLGDG